MLKLFSSPTTNIKMESICSINKTNAIYYRFQQTLTHTLKKTVRERTLIREKSPQNLHFIKCKIFEIQQVVWHLNSAQTRCVIKKLL